MYSTCVIWMGFFPIYFAGEHKEVTLCICVSLSAAIALLLLFVPKVYIIVWVPEKNTRGAFTTSRDVRCHIGSKSMASVDSVDLRESSTLDSLFKSEKGLGKVWRQKSLDERRLRFVMQRTNTGSDSDTPYSNHGVLSASTAALLPQQSRDKSFSESGAKMSSGQRKSLDSRVTYLDLPRDAREAQKSAVEALRQNLARDFPEHRRSPGLPPMRPGSPAEREKHKVKQSSLEHLVDLDTILRVSTEDEERGQRKLGKPGEFRKSLSSSCVSTSAKTKSVECQTSDELVQYLLPSLRRRCVNKNKKLERSCAVIDEGLHHVHSTDDSTGGTNQPPSSGALKAVRVFNYPSSYHQKHALTIQKQPVMFLTLTDDKNAVNEAARSTKARPKKNNDQGISGCNSRRKDSSQISFIPGVGQRCCQQFYHHTNQYINHRRGRKYHSMVVPPSHMSDQVCNPYQKTYRFPKMYGFGELTPSCSSDTSCVDDGDTAEPAGVPGRRPKSASPGHSVPLYSHGRTFGNEQEPFLSPAHLPRDSRSRSAGYIPLHTCCSDLHNETCSGVCWVNSFATAGSANDGSNVSTVSTTDSSSLIIPQFQSSVDSDVSQISNDQDDDEDEEDSNDNDGDTKDGLPEGLELYVTDPRTGGGRFPHSIFTSTTSGASMTNCQSKSEDGEGSCEKDETLNDPQSLALRESSNQSEIATTSCNDVDDTACLMQFSSPVDNGHVAAGKKCDSPESSSDMMEFQRLLEGHGVQIDLSKVQSSDL
ncbi:metabotropic glutamate receptor-like Protein [Elysia marginata]|uniref:Metabotropic glutamate receptor-like Protein n=1 Tax=Elysia marginata TaxID=1093978 RepID=A0AAV4GEW7_9GAST|nr:metabotropic glutamate receptor-like Protein [Elysia marginata]